MREKLHKLLKPKTVAIVGASERAGFGGDTTRNYLKFSKNLDNLYLVNPGRDEIFGRRSYHSLSEIPVDVDLVVLCTPQASILPLLREAAEKKCGGAVIFASGYSEIGGEGKEKQRELVEEANRLGIAVMGPNCAGFANFIDGVFSYAFLMEERERRGNIGMISQSGQLVLSAMDSPGMGFSYTISSGNSCNVKVEDYLDYLVDDEDTKVVCAYIEGITKPAQLIQTLRKAAMKKKPIVLLKTGKSNKARQLAASHTGSLSGTDKVIRSIFKRYGVLEAKDLQELYSIASVLSDLHKLPKGKKCVFMNVSGGEAGVTADISEEYGISLSVYSPETLAELKQLIPVYGSVNNPFDMTATIGYNVEAMRKALHVISDDDDVDAVCIGYTITPEIWDDTVTCMIDAIKLVHEDGGMKPLFWLPFVEHTRHPESYQALKDCGAALLPSGCYGCSVMKKVLDYATFEYEDGDISITTGQNQGEEALSEYESLNYLAEHGVTIPPQEVAETKEEAVLAAKKLGYPLSVKIHSRDIQHKSDVGGVKLHIQNEKELEEAFDAIMSSCAKNAPQAKLEGVLLKPMLKPGVEMIIGVSCDQDFGMQIMIGMGGVFVELFKDVQLAPAPLTRKKAMEMISSLKSYPLLNGYRGSEPCNVDALADLLVNISQMASECREEMKELDMNPVFVTAEGVAIADALLVKKTGGE